MERCMILDASSVIRKVTKRILTGEDLMFVEAENGAQALSMAAADMPDYVIVDTGITDFNVEDLIRKLRKMDKNCKTKIIASMTQVDLVSMTRAKRAGADDFMLKPFDRKMLLGQFRTFAHAA